MRRTLSLQTRNECLPQKVAGTAAAKMPCVLRQCNIQGTALPYVIVADVFSFIPLCSLQTERAVPFLNSFESIPISQSGVNVKWQFHDWVGTASKNLPASSAAVVFTYLNVSFLKHLRAIFIIVCNLFFVLWVHIKAPSQPRQVLGTIYLTQNHSATHSLLFTWPLCLFSLPLCLPDASSL